MQRSWRILSSVAATTAGQNVACRKIHVAL
jgi:hypothetical protein